MLQAQELVVCTYNIRYKNNGDTDAGNGWNTRRTYLINFVNFYSPDLFGVQEAQPGQMTDLANGLKDYAYIGVGRNDGGNGGEYAAIFYRKERMVLLDNGDFWLSDTPYKASKGFTSVGGSDTYYRICSWGKFYDKATKAIIYHFNTHLDLDETNRQQSFYLIKQKIQEIVGTPANAHVLISGDYNTNQTQDSYKLFKNSGFLYDCFDRASASKRFITNGTCAGFNGGNYSTVDNQPRRIDHIFITRPFTVNHYAALNPCYFSTSGTADYHERAYSDHSPVIVKLSILKSEMEELNADPLPMVDDVYQISSPKDLQAFAYIVNGYAGYTQNTAAKAVLTNDIDMSEIGHWRPIGTTSSPFSGTFDGQGHQISGFSLANVSEAKYGLFGYVKNADIRNFSINGSITCNSGASGVGVVGWSEGSTMTGIHSSLDIATTMTDIHHVGGVCGSLRTGSTASGCSFSGTLTDTADNQDCLGGIGGYSNERCLYENCVNYGTVSFTGTNSLAGGILGYVNNKYFNGVKNCLNIGSVQMADGTVPNNSGAIIGAARSFEASTIENNYWLEGSAARISGENTIDGTVVTAAQLEDGDICYALNGDQTNINWYQTLNTDIYPTLDATHEQVYYNQTKNFYYNLVNGEVGIKSPINVQCTMYDVQCPVYNLTGQRIANPQSTIHNPQSSIHNPQSPIHNPHLNRGIYIVNGRKVLF